MNKHQDLTEKIIAAYYKVYNTLGYGFLENVYEESMKLELKKKELDVIQQSPIQVFYEDQIVGEYFADLLIDNKVIVELKAAQTLTKAHEAQLLNYLKATEIKVGLLVNFKTPKAEIKRMVFNLPEEYLVKKTFPYQETFSI